MYSPEQLRLGLGGLSSRWDSDHRFPLGFFVCKDWKVRLFPRDVSEVERLSNVDADPASFDQYLLEFRALIGEIFSKQLGTPSVAKPNAREIWAYSDLVTTCTWLGCAQDMSIGAGDAQDSMKCWMLMRFVFAFERWSWHEPIFGDDGEYLTDGLDVDMRDTWAKAESLVDKIAIAHLAQEAFEIADYLRYCERYDNAIDPQAWQ
jgi:hypothetical protein